MENNQQQILSEIKTLMASVRNQLEELDAKIALWQQMVDPQEADIPIDLDFDLNMTAPEVPVTAEQIVEAWPVPALPSRRVSTWTWMRTASSGWRSMPMKAPTVS